jgi:hypothetical protein
MFYIATDTGLTLGNSDSTPSSLSIRVMMSSAWTSKASGTVRVSGVISVIVMISTRKGTSLSRKLDSIIKNYTKLFLHSSQWVTAREVL